MGLTQQQSPSEEAAMDNRPSDPAEPRDPLTPGDAGRVPGEHHEQPVPVDPQHGIHGDPSAGGVAGPHDSWEAARETYDREYDQRAIDNQPAFGATQPTGPSPYQPEGDAPPPQYATPNKGFPWLMCCGIGCGVLLLIGIGVGIWAFNWAKSAGESFTALGEGFEQATADANSISPEEARAQSTPISAADLSAAPGAYEDTWVAVTGELSSSEMSGSARGFANNPGLEDATSYWIMPNVMVLDVSGTARVGNPGDTVTAYGQPVAMDMSKLPVVGKMLAEEMKNDPELGGTAMIVFLIANSVEVTAAAGADSADTGDTAAGH
jgi:hypothetical protein